MLNEYNIPCTVELSKGFLAMPGRIVQHSMTCFYVNDIPVSCT